MAKNRIGRHGLHGAVAVVTVCGLAVACSGIPADPAPVFMKGGAPGIAAAGPEPAFPVSRQITSMPRPAAAMPRETRQVTVERGMSVGSLAGEYHVSKQAIIAANHLEPPYKIKLGFPLIIPGTAAPPVQQAMMSAPTPDVIPLDDPPTPRASAPPPAAPPRPAALSTPRPPAPLPAPVAALPPPPSAPQPAPPSHPPQPPPPPVAASAPQPAPQLAAPAKPIAFPPREPSAAEEARAETAASAAPPQNHGGGHFPWPLRGRVLASYGVAADGTHNDGINIAASRGTPIEAGR